MQNIGVAVLETPTNSNILCKLHQRHVTTQFKIQVLTSTSMSVTLGYYHGERFVQSGKYYNIYKSDKLF